MQHEGYLTWTTSSLPEGGQRLFTKLSPSLLMGQAQPTDPCPLDFVQLTAVTSCTLQGDRVLLEAEHRSSLLLVADSTQESLVWYNKLLTALGATEQYSTTSAPSSSAAPVSAATTGGNAAPGESPAWMRSSYEKFSAMLDGGDTTAAPRPLFPTDTRGGGGPPADVTQPMFRPAPSRPLPSFAAGGDAPSNGPTAPIVSRPIFGTSVNSPIPQQHHYRPLATTRSMVETPSRPVLPDVSMPAASTTSNVTHETIVYPQSMAATAAVSSPSDIGDGETAGFTAAASFRPDGSSRPIFNAAGSRPVSDSPLADNPSSRPFQTSAYRPHATPTPTSANRFGAGNDRLATAMGAASGAGNRKAPSMRIIELPATQNVNRNIAPNVSAIWKEWLAPDGRKYFLHEATHTLQRINPETGETETLVDGTGEVPAADLALLRAAHSDADPTVDVNEQRVRNLQAYGTSDCAGHVITGRGMASGSGIGEVQSPDVLRSQLVPTPSGPYSPSRRTNVTPLTAMPRLSQPGYQGKRVHRVTLGPSDEAGQSVIEHEVQTLQTENIVWDPRTGQAVSKEAQNGSISNTTLQRQWEHVRKVLTQGRYFKKHALRTRSESYRFVFLTGDSSYVCSVPTSEVLQHVGRDTTFSSDTEAVQYFGPESRAIAVNAITHVSLGTEESFVARRSRELDPASTFVIVSKTHALILECNTPDEAQFFCDAWNFFLYYSKPVNLRRQRTPQMTAPVTHGTRTGIAF